MHPSGLGSIPCRDVGEPMTATGGAALVDGSWNHRSLDLPAAAAATFVTLLDSYYCPSPFAGQWRSGSELVAAEYVAAGPLAAVEATCVVGASADAHAFVESFAAERFGPGRGFDWHCFYWGFAVRPSAPVAAAPHLPAPHAPVFGPAGP